MRYRTAQADLFVPAEWLFAQQPVQSGEELRWRLELAQPINDEALPIDEKQVRDRRDAESLAQRRMLIQVDLDQLHLLQAFADFGVAKSLFLEAQARATPRGPKVDHHWLPAGTGLGKCLAEERRRVVGQPCSRRLIGLGCLSDCGALDNFGTIPRLSDGLCKYILRAHRGVVDDRDKILGVVPANALDDVRPFQGRGDLIRSPQSRSAGFGLHHADHMERNHVAAHRTDGPHSLLAMDHSLGVGRAGGHRHHTAQKY